jgi:TetR/AcrR family transcriptional regulator, lmrAB and yxaGH operons repressor
MTKPKSRGLSLESMQLAIAQIFRRYGYDGASLDYLSAATGLGRSSLYHHFPKGKLAMGHTAIAQITSRFDQQILQPLQSTGEPLSRLQRMVLTLNDYYEQGSLACILIAFSVGESRIHFAPALRQITEQWTAAIASVLQETGCEATLAIDRAQEAIMQIEGALVMSIATDQKELFQRTLERLPERLLV